MTNCKRLTRLYVIVILQMVVGTESAKEGIVLRN